MSAALVEVTAEQARSLTDRIKVAVEGTWHLITEAYTTRAYTALGYANWDDYCIREFGTSRLPIPREERPERVASLRDAGLSIRAIENLTGHSKDTIRKAEQSYQIGTPAIDQIVNSKTGELVAEIEWADEAPFGFASAKDDDDLEEMLTDAELARQAEAAEAAARVPRITGTDGKSYPKPAPSAPKRSPLTDTFWKATYDLGKGVARVTNLTQDDRFNKHTDQIREKNLSDLIRARDALQCVIDQLTAQQGV